MDMMIDIETLGNRPGSAIISIGAVMFDKNGTGATYYNEISWEDCLKHGLVMDPSTVIWWMNQPTKPPSGTCPLYFALDGLNTFWGSHRPNRLWANSPSFDAVLLEVAYDKAGVTVPWEFRQLRDLRTALDAQKFDKSTVPFEGARHNALDDAIYQATVLIASGWYG